MSTLYDITAEFQELYELATDPDCDEQIFMDTLEGLMGELELKSKGYVFVIKQLEMEAKQAGEVAKAFTAKKKTRENHIENMKAALKKAMEASGTKEIPAGDYTIKLQKNGGMKPLKITGDVPENMTKVTIEPDNDKIREFLKNNNCDWAHLEEPGTHISIRE